MNQFQNPLTAEELAALLNISVFTVKALAKTRQLPCAYHKQQPRFNLEELFTFFQFLEEAASC